MENQKTLMYEQKKHRNYGVDLLRLISMFMVVTLHVLGQGGVLGNVSSLTLIGESCWGLEIICYCAVNVYAIISGYVGLKATHKWRNLIYLCLQVVFYAIIITAVELIVLVSTSSNISGTTIINHLIPSVRSLWYFSAYFCLFFFMPILNSIVENVSRNILKTVAVFIFLIFCCWTQLTTKTKVINLNGGYSVLWLAILYVVGAYMAKYKPLERCSVMKSFFGYLICIAVTILSRIVIGNIYIGRINLLVSYTSPTIVFSAIFLLNAFSKINVKATGAKVISFLAPMAFGVYLIHCHPFVFEKISGAFSWVATEPFYYAILLVLGIASAIFAVCLFVDWIRLLLFKIFKIKKFSSWFERILKKTFVSILKIFKISFENS